MYKDYTCFQKKYSMGLNSKKENRAERKRIDAVTRAVLGEEKPKTLWDTLRSSVSVPATWGTPTMVQTGAINQVPKVESNLGTELGIGAAGLLGPTLGGVAAEGAAFGPLYANAAKKLAVDIPAFEVLDRLPELWGAGRMTEGIGNDVERGVRYVMPDGRAEDIAAPALGTIARFASGVPLGGVADLMANNAGNIMRAASEGIGLNGYLGNFSGDWLEVPSGYDDAMILQREQDLLRGTREEARANWNNRLADYRRRLQTVQENLSGMPTRNAVIDDALGRIRVPFYDSRAANAGLAPNDPDFVNVFRERAIAQREANAVRDNIQRARRRIAAEARGAARAADAAAGAPENFSRDYGVTWDRYREILRNNGVDLSVADPHQMLANLETEAQSYGSNLRSFLQSGELPSGNAAPTINTQNVIDLTGRLNNTPLTNPVSSTATNGISSIPGNNEFIEDMFRQNWGIGVDEGIAFLRNQGHTINRMGDVSAAFRDLESSLGSRTAVRNLISSSMANQGNSAQSSGLDLLKKAIHMPRYDTVVSETGGRGQMRPLFISSRRPNPEEFASMKRAIPSLSDDELFNAYMGKVYNAVKVTPNRGMPYERDYVASIENDSMFRDLAREMQKRFGSTQGSIPGYEGETFHFGSLAGTEYDKLARWVRFAEDSPYVKNAYQYSLPGDAEHFSWFNDYDGNLNGLGKNAGQAALDYQRSVPAGSAVTERYTSVESEPLKASGALTNYGHGKGQSYVEILRDEQGKPILEQRNFYGHSNRVNMDTLSKDLEEKLKAYQKSVDDVAKARAKKIAEGKNPKDVLDPVMDPSIKAFLEHIDNGSVNWVNELNAYLTQGRSDYEGLFNDFIRSRIARSRANVIRKIGNPIERAAAIEGWTDIPKPFYNSSEKDILNDLLEEIKQGNPYFEYNPQPYSVAHHVIQHDLGGTLLHPYAKGGDIHIKPSHRGRFTALLERTGKPASWFKAHGTPAQRKMATFALNARKWKHADGGPLDDIDYSGIATTNHRKYNQDYISYIDSSLANANLAPAQRASILANIIEESGGNPFAIDSTGKFYGLMQWADDRYQATGEQDPYREIDNQVNHILNTLGNTTDGRSWTHGGTGSGYNSYKDAMADFDSEDLATAMKGFTLGYVRPTGKMASYNNRLKVAEQLLERYNNIPERKAATVLEKLKSAFGNDTEAMRRLVNAAKGGFR